jgi:parvulin-like peptidyl-prolyl isomerase
VSRAEFLEVVKRNAYLRAIAAAHIKPTNAQIEAEYRRSYGKRAEIRHIQAPTFAEAKKAAELVKVGADFAQVARESSTNLRTAPGGGLLPPFSREDESVPKPLREAAFSLKEDEVSAPIRVDDWYHVVRLERFIAADQTPLAQIRPEVEHRLRLRMIEPTVQQLYRSLFEQADIKINDPTLEREFERKHPKPRRTTR